MMELIQEIVKDGYDTNITYESWISYSMKEKVELLKSWMKELQDLDNNLVNEHGHTVLKRRKDLKSLLKNATIFESAYFKEDHDQNS